jgi:hypothetical protein
MRLRLTPVGAVETIAIPFLLAAATFLGAQPWLRVFSVPGTTVLVVVAAALPVVAATATIRLARQPPPVSYTVSLALLVVLVLAANGFHPGQIFHGLRAGPNQLLTETLPLGGNRGVLTGPLLLTWLGGAASAEVVLRSRRRDTGWPAAGLAVPMGCYVLAYAVGASRPGAADIGAPLLLGALVLIAVLRHGVRLATTKAAGVGSALEADARPSNWRPGLIGAVVAGGVIAILAATLPSISHLSHRPVTVQRPAPLANVSVLDPVDALASLRDSNPTGSAVPQLQITTSQSSTGYLAMAVLDHYDGASWSFDATFQPTGGRIPSPPGTPPAVVSQRDVRQDITLEAPLPLPLLPALDRPLTVTGIDAAADDATGMLIPSRPLGASTAYSVVSHAPAATLTEVPKADGIGTAVNRGATAAAALNGAADLALPASSSAPMTTVLQYLSRLTGLRPAPTVAFLQAAVGSLRAADRRIDPTLGTPAPTAPAKGSSRKKGRVPATTTTTVPANSLAVAGTSLSEVINAVTIKDSGTPEQFATMVAMVARFLGVPARLVTGYRMASSSAGTPVTAGTYQVTNRQAWAWVEIPVAGVGWVVIDPSPDGRTLVPPPAPQQAQATATTLPPPQANAVPKSEIAGGHALAKPSVIRAPKSHPTAWWVLAVAALGAAIILGSLAGPGLAGARRALRRRARRGEDPSHLAVGAWLELLDGLEQAGMVAGPSATGAEVAAEAGRYFGVDVAGPIRYVAGVADQALCSTVAPDATAASEAWSAQHTVRRTVLHSLDRRQRSRALLAVGSAPRRPEK